MDAPARWAPCGSGTTCPSWTQCRALPPSLENVMKNSRKPLAGLIALGAALAIPMAFAQDATTAPPQDPATQDYPTQSTAPSTSQQPLTWADLDVDGNGTLSPTAPGSLQTRGQFLNKADARRGGVSAPDAYKAFGPAANAGQPEGGRSDRPRRPPAAPAGGPWGPGPRIGGPPGPPMT